jgi:hypothetical protein
MISFSRRCLLSLYALVLLFYIERSILYNRSTDTQHVQCYGKPVSNIRMYKSPLFCNTNSADIYVGCVALQPLQDFDHPGYFSSYTQFWEIGDRIFTARKTSVLKLYNQETNKCLVYISFGVQLNSAHVSDMDIKQCHSHKLSGMASFYLLNTCKKDVVPSTDVFLFQNPLCMSTSTYSVNNSAVIIKRTDNIYIVAVNWNGIFDYYLKIQNGIFSYLLWFMDLILQTSMSILRRAKLCIYEIPIFLVSNIKGWDPYICRLNLFMINCYFTKHASVVRTCKKLKALLMRNNFRRTDFHSIRMRRFCFFRQFTSLFIIASYLSFVFKPTTCDGRENVKNLEDIVLSNISIGGGRRTPIFVLEDLFPEIDLTHKNLHPASRVKFIGHKHNNVVDALYKDSVDCVYGKVPLKIFVPDLTVKDIKAIAKVHGIHIPPKIRAGDISNILDDHLCQSCNTHVSVFTLYSVRTNAERCSKWYNNIDSSKKKSKINKTIGNRIVKNDSDSKSTTSEEPEETILPIFPPSPASNDLKETIIREWCADTSPVSFMEGGCAVCGQLTLLSNLSKVSELKCDLDPILREGMGVTRLERSSSDDPIQEIKGPVLDETCDKLCGDCKCLLEQGLTPKCALANGFWLGSVPIQLQHLSYAEQLLVARVRRNKCVVQVSSGMHKMKANVIAFENPTPKIYHKLPPPIEDLDEVLAFIFTGPCLPTEDDLKRTPLLVRRNKVGEALEWLKLNHSDYHDLNIDYECLNSYPEDRPPVVVTYRKAFANKLPESASAFDNEIEEGVDTGQCPFTVNGITGEKLNDMAPKALAAVAAKHLKEENGKVLSISHAETPQSIYDNPQLYPMMFPWLFPYGLGGVGSVNCEEVKISDIMHKRKLLMYHDKRFQLDPHFPLIAFNQEQIKSGTTGGYLLTERRNFEDIAERLMNVDTGVLEDLSKRLMRGERVKPVTKEEKDCYMLISDLDHVGGRVPGSITSKKYMRNEIWSLISYAGAPSWFITFAPADNKHPICLYYADTKETFSPEIRTDNDRYRLIAKNPVAGARFFNFMVEMFIKHVLGVGKKHPGVYGKTSAYYGTVEQQGRLTLHLHLLLWISGVFTPQEIRDKIMDPTSDFQKEMVKYLESLCVGEFLTGPKLDVSERVGDASTRVEYRDPTLTLPDQPPPPCEHNPKQCYCNDKKSSWRSDFKDTVDDILLRSNQHTHKYDQAGNNISYCATVDGECKRRFPRDIFEQTMVDPKTGALNLKKGEAWMNTITPLLTYLLRCNTDVTSLLSGTAIKAIVAYVSDYITKPGLKTYTVFDVVKSVFDKNSEMIGGDLKRREKVRKIFTQIVNSLTAKLEIGGPMASLYILGHPDHYTGHRFIPFYWKGYVKEVLDAWVDEHDDSLVPDLKNVTDNVVINKNRGRLVGLSKISDYIYRPTSCENVCLYDWVRLSKKSRIHRSIRKKVGDPVDDPEFDESDDELNIHPDDYTDAIEDEQTKAATKDKPDLKRTKNDIPSLRDFIEDDIGYFGDVHVDDDNEESDDELDVMEELAEKDPKYNDYFRPGHPQSHTHCARMRKKNPLVVPNFLPNTLPRSDSGDREYYCCTMLTLFKPWRNGKYLKSEKESWDKAFVAHKFSKRQLEIMKYFNLRYECLDARDDYSAKCNKQTGSGINFQWATSEMLADLDDFYDTELVIANGDEDDDADSDALNVPGSRGRAKIYEMMAAERTMKQSGWLDECEDGSPDVGPLHPVEPECKQPAKAWRAAVLAKKQEIIDERNKYLPTNVSSKNKPKPFKPNTVKVVDKAYIDKKFKITSKADDQSVDSVIKKFLLNTEQERAFRIIANHAMMTDPDKLRMYLGGMGGTGKSQVIKALMCFFHERKEDHRFLVVAPTGAAAALLNGSTYHSVLGINDGEYISAKTLANIRARLDGIDYIFLDEVSMLSCRDMYKISAQAAKARGVHDEPFGGINFIFAGDFAQLPPARSGAALYSGNVGTWLTSGLNAAQQEAAIGKALWHQVTTVVILRENMRQAKQTADDAKLRSALENMRYRSCTSEDITFLRSRIAGKGPNDPKLAQKRFRNVSIITARNSQRDKINQLGCKRFATENNQTLKTFYSIDRWKNPEDGRRKGVRSRPKKKLIDPIRKTNILSPNLQRILWKQPHASSDKHVPGKLDLCIGMPVMLKYNDATECCITKGTEATVVGWQTEQGPEGQVALETLFVELKDPPKMIKINGLPINVVPITRHTTATMCYLPNDDQISLSRDQVLVLPNFAMTDYASQGRTRPNNIVDLNSCSSHQSYYTCLSRSASAAGTIIVQGFDPRIVTGGASGYLRQEFRELELLDEITRLKYENILPDYIVGDRRNTIIREFQRWKGTEYVPEHVHPSLKWNRQDPLHMLDDISDSPWQIIKNNKSDNENKVKRTKRSDTVGFIAAKGTIPVNTDSCTQKRKRDVHEPELPPKKKRLSTPAPTTLKRKLMDLCDDTDRQTKKIKITEMSEIQNRPSECPRGFIWDNENYSCAYDSLLTILLVIWSEDPSRWKTRFKDMNRVMNVLASRFYRVDNGQDTLESARDKIRHLLHQRSPALFPYGQMGTPIHEMVEQLLRSDHVIMSSWIQCVDCGDKSDLQNDLQTCVIQCHQGSGSSTAARLKKKFRDLHPRKRCTWCNGKMENIARFKVIPKILAFSVSDSSIHVNKRISFSDGDSNVVFNLKGIIYFGDFHYTARVCKNEHIWFNDGMIDGRNSAYEKPLRDFTDVELSTCHDKSLSIVIYAQK